MQWAIDDYSSAISIDSTHAYAFLQRGRLRAIIGDYAGAMSDFTAHIDVASFPHERLSGLLNRGNAKYAVGDLSGAISDLTEAIVLEGESPIYGPLFRGRVKVAAGDYNGAISDFSAAITAFPKLTNAYRHRAGVRLLIGDNQGAADDRSHYEQLGGKDLPAYS